MSLVNLHQVTALVKGSKQRSTAAVSALHHLAQKPDAYAGLQKNYRVQLQAPEVLADLAALMTEPLDLVSQQEFANATARADLIVDGVTIVAGAPVSLLLALEKNIVDIRTFVDKMPTLDEAKDWHHDVVTGVYRTEPVSTSRTQKVQEPIVLAQATREHPAQTQLISVDKTVGTWDTVHLSGALPAPRKKELLARTDRLLQAVRVARETANGASAPGHPVGATLFGYLLK